MESTFFFWDHIVTNDSWVLYDSWPSFVVISHEKMDDLIAITTITMPNWFGIYNFLSRKAETLQED